MDNLSKLESKSIYIIREAYNQHKNVALLWSIGKDSTTLLWMIRKAFFGKIPFPVMHLDTGYKFKEIYEFRDKYAKKWGLDLIVEKNQEAFNNKNIGPKIDRLECCTELKTNNLKNAIEKYKFKALYLAIRRDEHGIRAKERVVSPRDKDFIWDYKNQPPEIWDQYKTETKEKEHLRIHPLLDWTELDVWQYVRKENIPIVSLYLSKNGKRYRSIGCETCCNPIDSNACNLNDIIEELKTTKVSERSGRAQDKESDYMMQKLRSLGYM
ncbi:MAG: sulfate adenylyltransferase subunit 2 [Candidatus Pacebacteria bacterium]|nr:sulfate adenylyltransferase subunit 2 [Candidatus Paceibacterota bacterium]